ncbi:AI-2E family transporter [Methylobacterium sp. ID0610]|uniref:AI-2E family transporter n=1 Tax=Methylobacterium carpenticola TaxID=3344827 RepID=UPI00367E3616
MLDPAPPLPATAAPAVSHRLETAAQILAGLALLATLQVHLLGALLAGLLVHELVHLLAPRWAGRLVHHHTAKVIVVTVLAALVVAGVTAAILGLIALLSGGSDNLAVLLRKMAEVIETARSRLPAWAVGFLPEESTELRAAAVAWLRDHAGQLRALGQDVWRALLHIVFGLVIGGMVAVSRESGMDERGPLVHALMERARLLADAFRRVVFAQVRISALNTGLTALYLLVAVPWLGIPLPFTKTMVVVTFVVGLLPVIGNLISNTVIVLVSLSVSPALAVSSLAFLVAIHKLEYFVNARVMGGQIQARAWELLTAMLVMETVFGIPGLVAAPIFYAYLKNELALRRLI